MTMLCELWDVNEIMKISNTKVAMIVEASAKVLPTLTSRIG